MLLVGRDSRPVMRAAWACFRGDEPLPTLVTLGALATGASPHDVFYAALYEGLFLEAQAFGDGGVDVDGASSMRGREAILRAIASPYGQQSGDYMAALARVHAQVRKWL